MLDTFDNASVGDKIMEGREVLDFCFFDFCRDIGVNYNEEDMKIVVNIVYEFFRKEHNSHYVQYTLFDADEDLFYFVYRDLLGLVYIDLNIDRENCIKDGLFFNVLNYQYPFDELNCFLGFDIMRGEDYLVKTDDNLYESRYIPYFEGEEKKFYRIDKRV